MANSPATKPKESIWDTLRTILYALLIAVAFRTILFQPFSIPSGSMKPTLLVGDYLFVSKYAYGWSRHSLPFSPELFQGRIWGATPERGDIIVFKLPRDGRTDYIKRLVGLPGDRVQVIGGVLHVNGKPVSLVEKGVFTEVKAPQGSEGNMPRCMNDPVALNGDCHNAQFLETLPGGRAHMILNSDGNTGFADNTAEFTVPPGQYFFMGDNRDNSTDSRFMTHVGFVPAENLIGRAEMVVLSFEGRFWEIWNWRADRFFRSLR